MYFISHIHYSHAFKTANVNDEPIHVRLFYSVHAWNEKQKQWQYGLCCHWLLLQTESCIPKTCSLLQDSQPYFFTIAALSSHLSPLSSLLSPLSSLLSPLSSLLSPLTQGILWNSWWDISSSRLGHEEWRSRAVRTSPTSVSYVVDSKCHNAFHIFSSVWDTDRES